MHNLPNDAFILLSLINTLLRDNYPSLFELCRDRGYNRTEIEQKLAGIGYAYNEKINQFKS